jgi:hypothetical protein
MNATILFLSYVAFSQSSESLEITSQKKQPKLRLGKTAYNFGDVWQGNEVKCAYKLFNEGEADLVILKQKTTCGCAVAKPVNGSIAPGTSKTLDVTFSVGNRMGAISKKILLFTNDPQQPQVVLTVSANVKQIAQLNPSLIDFGDIIVGSTVTAQVDLIKNKDVSERPLKIKQKLESINELSVEIVESTHDKAKMSVSFTPEKAIEYEESITMELQELGLPTIKLPVRAKVHNRFFVEPQRVFFGFAKSSSSITRTISIGAPSTEEITELILSHDEDNKDIEFVLRKEGSGFYNVDITWTPANNSSNLNHRVSITAMNGDEMLGKVIVPCYGLLPNNVGHAKAQ